MTKRKMKKGGVATGGFKWNTIKKETTKWTNA